MRKLKAESGRLSAAISTLVAGAVITTSVIAPSAPATAAIDAAGQRCFSVTGSSGDAAIINLTPVNASASGNGLLISSDVKNDPPIAANTNFRPGSVDPNVAAASIGGDGAVCFQNSVHATVDLVADHLGNIAAAAYEPATATGAPARSVDTRTGAGTPIAPGGQLCFAVSGSPGDAAIVNLTPVQANTSGNGLLISSDVKSNPPIAANTNFRPGSVDPNVAVAAIGADGQVCFQNSIHATVHLVADHLGTIAANAYTPATPNGEPERRVDTRTGAGTPIAPSAQLCFAVSGSPGDAAIVNLTPVQASANGNGLLISSDIRNDPPVAANTNFQPGSVDPNVAITPIGADGQVCFQNSVHATVHLVADHLGTIAGSSYTPATPTGAPDRKIDTRIDDIPPACRRPTTTNYDTVTARIMFGLASKAYEIDPGVYEEGTRLDQTDETGHFEEQMACWSLVDAIQGGELPDGPRTDTQLFIARNVHTGDIAVAFRGTEGWIDFENDVNSLREPFTLPDGRVVQNAAHKGFNTAYRAARNRIVGVFDNIGRPAPDTRVYFTGHSLGGALATLASLDLADELRALGYVSAAYAADEQRAAEATDRVITYTFGAPRAMSQTLAGHHGTFVPFSYAVANPMDPIPQVPTAIGSDPYSHVPNMRLLTKELANDTIRLDSGDGRGFRGCLDSFPPSIGALAANFAIFHVRTRYHERLSATQYAPKPDANIHISSLGFVQLRWGGEVEGPCDVVALYRSASEPGSGSIPLHLVDVRNDFDNQEQTVYPKGTQYWVAYKGMFRSFHSVKQYFPSTPTVWLRRNDNGIFPDTIDMHWSVSDPGPGDLVVLFDQDPRVVGPDNWYVSPVGRVESSPLLANSPDRKATWVGSDPNKWWIAYIMTDVDGSKRILAVGEGVAG